MLGGYIWNDALYHLAEVDESTPIGAEIAQSIREGHHRQVSLTHYQGPDGEPLNLELSLCTGKGAREGSGIIEVWPDDKPLPEGFVSASAEESDMEEDNYRKEQQYYLNHLVSASEEATSVVVPQFANPEASVTLVMSSSSSPDHVAPSSTPTPLPSTPAPVADAPAPQRPGDALEEKLAKFKDQGVAPDDARPGETYQLYLMRVLASGGNVMSKKLIDRVLEAQLEAMESQQRMSQQLEEQKSDLSEYTANIVEPLVRKFGARAPTAVSVDEVREAARQLDKRRLMDIASNMMAISASDELSEHRTMMADRERLLKEEREAIALRRAVLEQERDREKREEVVNRMRLLSQQMPPAPRPSRSGAPLTPEQFARDKNEFRSGALDEPAAVAATNPLPAAAERVRMRKAQAAQRFIAEQMRMHPNDTRVDGMSDQDWEALRRRIESNADVPVSDTLSYLKAKGVDTSATRLPDGVQFSSAYVPGIVAASDEFIHSHYPEKVARNLTNDFNSNLDKASMVAYHSGVRAGKSDVMDISAYMRSGHSVLLPRVYREGNRHYEGRWNPAEGHLYDRPVDGWRNAQKSFIAGQALSADPQSRFYRGASYGYSM